MVFIYYIKLENLYFIQTYYIRTHNSKFFKLLSVKPQVTQKHP